MSNKVDLEVIKSITQRRIADIRVINEIMSDIQAELKAEEEEKANRPPPVKKQFVVMLSDPEGALKDQDITGWVLQIPEEDNMMAAPQKVIAAAYEFNTTPKGRRMPVQTIGEACESVSAKIFKEQNVWVKTKTPVIAVSVDNAIPTDESE